MRLFKTLFALATAAPLAYAPIPASAVPVGLELALLVDVSSSVSGGEFALQRDGYVQAFQNPAIQALISGITGGIAVTYIQWSSGNQQQQSVGWTQVTDAASANALATAISNAPRAFSGATGPGSAINFSVPLFSNNGFEGVRLVIDVSGDGEENSGADTSDARDAALAAGITTINGIAIGGGQTLFNFYQNNIVGGLNAFTLQADSFDDFATAITNKLGREIGGGGDPVPEPASLAILGASIIGLAGLRRRRSA
jgi:hypothetical protein